MRCRLFLIILLTLSLAGCATAQKKISAKEQILNLEARITELENELQQKENEVGALEKRLSEAQKKSAAIKAEASKKGAIETDATAHNIQKALKNADLYDGPIDGKIGKKTKMAIKEFQRLNELKEDGIVGKKTWAKLKEFLY